MDMSLEKNKLLLDILNEILIIQNKPQIENIKDFILEKEILTKTDNYPILENKYEEIFKYYKKNETHYRRNQKKNYIVILLRNMCKEIGFKMGYKPTDKGINMDGINYRKKSIKYTIE